MCLFTSQQPYVDHHLTGDIVTEDQGSCLTHHSISRHGAAESDVLRHSKPQTPLYVFVNAKKMCVVEYARVW